MKHLFALILFVSISNLNAQGTKGLDFVDGWVKTVNAWTKFIS
jgi:hypothetical protein